VHGFAEGKPIGQNGLIRLKIHLANNKGKDKLSFTDMVLDAESMLLIVERCVKDPLKSRGGCNVRIAGRH